MSDIPLSNGRVYRDGLIFDFKPTDRSGAATLYPIPTGTPPQFPRVDLGPLEQLAQKFMRLLNAHGWALPDDPFNTADWYTPEEEPVSQPDDLRERISTAAEREFWEHIEDFEHRIEGCLPPGMFGFVADAVIDELIDMAGTGQLLKGIANYRRPHV